MSTRSDTFFRTKRKVTAAIDFRLKNLYDSSEALSVKPRKFKRIIADYDARIDELETLRDYVRNGMLWDKRPGRRKKE